MSELLNTHLARLPARPPALQPLRSAVPEEDAFVPHPTATFARAAPAYPLGKGGLDLQTSPGPPIAAPAPPREHAAGSQRWCPGSPPRSQPLSSASAAADRPCAPPPGLTSSRPPCVRSPGRRRTPARAPPLESESERCPALPHSLRPGRNAGVGSRSLLRGIFPSRGWNPGLPHGRRILYQLSHQGSPRMLEEWVAFPFSRSSLEFSHWSGSVSQFSRSVVSDSL